jgi:hypothetical protein
MGKTRHRKSTDQPRACFVVVSWEGCWCPDVCQAQHVLVDCEVHGLLARVEHEDTGRFIMAGHMDTPAWPVPLEPLTEACLDRIAASRTSKSTLFVPSTYRGGGLRGGPFL